MNMVFCRGCAKEIHETAIACPDCGAPQTVSSDSKTETISESWQQRFELLEKAGGVKTPNLKNLPFGERRKIVFNIWGFLFGPLYYLAKGMWKKAISLFGICILIIVALEAICQVIGISDKITNFVAAAVFASRATIDYYKKVKLNDNGWW
jgi:uncharacterized membrane protein YvbJ